jgi:UPF0042 nucleotide-binding protein
VTRATSSADTRDAGDDRPATSSRPTAAVRPAADGAAQTDHLIIISGLSGAGKSQASKQLEDLGYYCVDNLPPQLLDGFLGLLDAEPQRYHRAALVLDIRGGDPAPAIDRARAELAARDHAMTLLFLEASDSAIVSRFSETRHRHPLQDGAGVQGGIAEERRRLAATRQQADTIIDTSGLSIGQLRERILSLVPNAQPEGDLRIDILTFGFKFGLPMEADLVFDVRFLTNPYWVPNLKPLSGLHESVRDYVLSQPSAARFLDLVIELLDLTLPAYRAEGKSRLTVALGCTGGYHRSIALAEELAQRLRHHDETEVAVFHRELDR